MQQTTASNAPLINRWLKPRSRQCQKLSSQASPSWTTQQRLTSPPIATPRRPVTRQSQLDQSKADSPSKSINSLNVASKCPISLTSGRHGAHISQWRVAPRAVPVLTMDSSSCQQKWKSQLKRPNHWNLSLWWVSPVESGQILTRLKLRAGKATNRAPNHPTIAHHRLKIVSPNFEPIRITFICLTNKIAQITFG